MIYILIGFVIVALDILTKFWAKNYLSDIGSIPLVENVFHLTYVENRGAAFGIMQGQGLFFVFVAFVFAAVILFCLVKFKNRSGLLNLGLTFMLAGAFGNTFDRIMQGFVVDFLDFSLINFPVFNVADIFVCVGAGLLAIFFIFFDKADVGKGECDEGDS